MEPVVIAERSYVMKMQVLSLEDLDLKRVRPRSSDDKTAVYGLWHHCF